MKPWQILVFFICVAVLLFTMAYVFPENGIYLSENLKLKFFRPDILTEPDSNYYADITDIIENVDIDEEMPLAANDSTPGIEILEELIPVERERVDPDSLKKLIHKIEFPASGKGNFIPLFERLHNIGNSRELLRILHYGDSQIETDRMSGPIRNKLHKRFGGSGCGLVPAVPLYKGKMSVSQDFSKHWERFTGFGKIDTTRGHNSYGALISYASYNPEKLDTMDYSWIELRPSPIAYSTARRFNEVSLYLSKKNEDYLSMEFLINDSVFEKIEALEDLNYNKISWNFNQTPKSFKIKFRGKGSPELYGISLDNKWGVALDNIPLRGSAGLVFSKNDTVQLRQMYEDLNVGMIILQFGGNVVPYMSNAKVYKKIFKRELKVIKSLAPDAAVLVVGPSDMSLKENGNYITYPHLEKVRDAMRNASLESGYAFWDMYKAMGGRNSMPSWVFANPPLAINDFVHFNARGSRVISEMLFSAFMYEYNQWEKSVR